MKGLIPGLHDVYTFRGTPYEIGYQTGKATLEAKKEDVLNYVYRTQYITERMPLEEYTIERYKERYPSLYAEWNKMVESEPEWVLEGIQGLADGMGIPYEKALTNYCHYPLAFPETIGDVTTMKTGIPQPSAAGCNGFAAYGKGVEGGHTIVAESCESMLSWRTITTISYIMNEKLNNIVRVDLGGQGGVSLWGGMNDKGLCLLASAVSVTKEEHGLVGKTYLNRWIALSECDTVDELIDYFKETKIIQARHLYVADSKRAVHLEYSGRHLEVLEPERGFSQGASPMFSSPKLRQYNSVLTDETDPRFSYSIAKKRGDFRMERYDELFEEKKPLTPAKCVELLGDHGGKGASPDNGGPYQGGSDYTICVHGSKTESGDRHYHASSEICVPSLKCIYVAFGSPCEAEFIQFKAPKSN